LESHIDFEKVAPNRSDIPTLQPIHDTLAALADPHHDYPKIHVTGTNGKTSTARILTALLMAEGLSVGTFSSPHLQSVCDRIGLDGAPIDEVRLAELLTRIATIEEFLDDRPSYFEVLTAAAFDLFAEVAVDVAVAVAVDGREKVWNGSKKKQTKQEHIFPTG
jgi:dihydrofolate synthase/folylpolyglutamate synthase